MRRVMRHWRSVIPIAAAAAFFGCIGAAAQSADVGSSATGPELFARVYAVLHHPRCSNCHPSDDRPRWGDAVHGMNVQRGAEVPEDTKGAGGYGRTGMQCRTCHQEENSPLPGSPPGAEGWRLAPKKTMGWGGFDEAKLCHDFRDRIDKVMYHLVPHVDPLVKWAWDPGPGRQSPPGNVDQFVNDMIKWEKIVRTDSRAACRPD